MAENAFTECVILFDDKRTVIIDLHLLCTEKNRAINSQMYIVAILQLLSGSPISQTHLDLPLVP